jgi:hypothetical protein
MPRPCRFTLLLLLPLAFASPARADRRWFVQSYTPYLASAGSLDLETTTIGAYGQGDSAATALATRIELEYGITDRLTGAGYLNFVQAPGSESAMRFDGPSLEFIYRPADPGVLPLDAAGYLEVRANGDELELEPKLLLARRYYELVGAVNVIGEIEHHYAGEYLGETEKNLRVTAGLTRELGKVAAFGLEGFYDRPDAGGGASASAFYLGPTLNLQSTRAQLTLGWQQQLSGHPASGAGLDLADFPRSEVRLIVGVSL